MTKNKSLWDKNKPHHPKRGPISYLKYFTRNLLIVTGIVLIWRGLWNVFDLIDARFFGGNNLWVSLGGIALGLIILYVPDKDLKEIEGPL